jgi:glucosylceramidase
MEDKIKVFLTARDTDDRLTEKQPLPFEDDPEGIELRVINVYDDVEYQEMIGFGGAFTEAAAYTLQKLPEDKQEEVLAAYFDEKKGHRYTFCRTHMNSSDFALGNYACVEKEGDVELESFNIERDKKYIIPMIKAAARYGKFHLFISPWSPPGWMKDTGIMNRGGKLLPQYRDAWARHFARFIKAYENEGIPVWGLTVQNEPKAVQTWDSCIFTAEEEKDFVRDYLGPVLEREGLGHIKIMIWDHNKERIYERAKVAFEDPEAAKYIWGVAFHWYSGDHFEALEAVHHKWPDKPMALTECCVGFGGRLDPWSKGERYGHDIIGNLNNYMSAWCDWNLILDEKGGPNHVHNYCEAPIMIDTRVGTIEYKPSYYYIGHFSRFIEPGSVRIGFSRYTEKLKCTAFKTPSGGKVLIVMNDTDDNIPFVLRYNDKIAKCESVAHSIMTLVF